LFVGWCLNGVAMALGLYDVAFAAVYQERRGEGRRVVVGVTLLAGFASTIFWPLSRHLAHVLGLRATFVVFAGLLLATIPMYWWSLGPRRQAESSAANACAIESRSSHPRTIALLAAAFATASFVTGAIGAHLLATLGALSVPAAQVTWVASLIGVTQVVGRVLEVSLGSRTSPIRTGFAALGVLAMSFVLLAMTAATPSLAWAFVIAFGMSNGVLTIARATIPVALFGSEGIGDILGRLGRPAVVARAVAPWCFAVVADAAGSTTAVALLAVGAGVCLVTYGMAIRSSSTVHTADAEPMQISV
jgi:predicted MFS family arabinose efflux permease